MYDCKSYELMKEHYKSEFHKYNLNRVTMNMNPLTHPEYIKKKEIYQKLHESKAATPGSLNLSDVVVHTSLNCDLCRKTFSTLNKIKEHMTSKNHKKVEEDAKSRPVEIVEKKNPEDEKTTKDDVTICLFCNNKSDNIENNIIHMINIHKFEVPFIFCIKKLQGLT